MAVPEQEHSLAKAVGRTSYDYAVYLNGRRRRSGHVWQNRFYSTSLDRDHLIAALRYVDMNPVRARLVVEAVSYEWSSAAAHVTGKDPTGLLDGDTWLELCPLNDWDEVLAAPTPEVQLAARLRQATRTGRPLGSPEFISELEARLQRTLTRQKPGPAGPKPQAFSNPRMSLKSVRVEKGRLQGENLLSERIEMFERGGGQGGGGS